MSEIDDANEQKIFRRVVSGRVVQQNAVLKSINITPIRVNRKRESLLDMNRKIRTDKMDKEIIDAITNILEEDCQAGNLKMTLSSIPQRQHREKRVSRPPSGKRVAAKDMPGRTRSTNINSLDPCDNSSDSGLGFDHHIDTRSSSGITDRLGWPNSAKKKPRMDVKIENGIDIKCYSFPETLQISKQNSTLIPNAPSGSVSLGCSSSQDKPEDVDSSRCMSLALKQSILNSISLTTQLIATSRISEACLTIVKQPEQQHRARYQTEGSRGAVKDRDGNGFPIVRLDGYHKPTILQVFVGTDVGKVSPHMFYQACKVSGKNSTPCVEKKIDGTCVIELQLDPSKDMSATCDCVGILKERNVDVEHRFPDQLVNRSKKKSTRCRMVFRAYITHENGRHETLQVCSQPIVCTQPPGIPEICKKSLTACPARGGLELFVLGKNFSKDTKVYFQQIDEESIVNWEQECVPDKEYLQQTHFVCVVPSYQKQNITEPVSVRLFVIASGKTSESHQFVFTPVNGVIPSASTEATSQQSPFFNKDIWPATSSMGEQDLNIMPPPETSMVPLTNRRLSLSATQSLEVQSPTVLSMKQEFIDENSQGSFIDSSEIHHERYRHISESSLDVHHGDSNISTINENSMDVIHHSNMSPPDVINHDSSNTSMTEKSMEIMSRPTNSINEKPIVNSSMCLLNENISCDTMMQCPAHINTINSSSMYKQIVASPPHQSEDLQDLKVMDLRLKMPMGAVAELVNTNPSSLAALQNFSVNTNTLSTQNALIVESFLTNIESKTTGTNSFIENLNFKSKMTSLTNDHSTSIQANDILSNSSSQLQSLGESININSHQNFNVVTHTSNNSIQVFGKHLQNRIIEDRNKPSAMLQSTLTTPFNTERLDAFLNSTADNLINNTTRSEPIEDSLISESSTISRGGQTNRVLSSQSSLMGSPILNAQIPSTLNDNTVKSNMSSDIILNAQISPSMMCQTTNILSQESILPSRNICQSEINNDSIATTVSSQRMLIEAASQNSDSELGTLNQPISSQLSLVDSENAVLLEAAVDLLQTQKKISELDSLSTETKEPIINKLYMSNLLVISNVSRESKNVSPSSGGVSNVQPPPTENFNASSSENDNSEFIIPLSVKEIQTASNTIPSNSNDKKIDNKVITPRFSSFTENELIDFINPSCFDQDKCNYT
ncbi:hypothetical protein HHI36_004846 [Cryptolaemus montrouzieri]|uniref:Nuclear factor of activated T-cells 5 n=1 Tax=Cryptolaemus montrouzieri TaxID=559131 RepID=A0ABD2NSJ3_9CUCU